MPTAFVGRNVDTGAEELVMVFINATAVCIRYLICIVPARGSPLPPASSQ